MAETGDALTQIEGVVVQVDANITEIATGVDEQSQGLKAISASMNELDQTTQQNAAMAEESAALSYTLSTEAASLGQLVSRFQLNRRSEIRTPEVRAAFEASKKRVA